MKQKKEKKSIGILIGVWTLTIHSSRMDKIQLPKTLRDQERIRKNV
jgi:hypothetical protein